jgi:N-acetylglucosamine-6-sulfatase
MRRLAAALACAALLTACSGWPSTGGEHARQASAIPVAPPPSVVATADLPANDGPNILVVTTDDMRWDELRYTPNVRKYVTSRGLLFENSFAPNPLCCPSRASFLLGQYSHNHRVYSHEAPYGFGVFDDHLTVGTVLNQAGYQTALVGKYLNGYGQQPSRVTGGSSVTYVPDGWTDWMVSIEHRWPKGSPYVGGTYDYSSFTQNVNGRVVSNRGKYSSAVVGDQVRSLVGKYGRTGHPWFIWATPVAPHFGGPKEADDPENYRGASGYLSRFQTPARPKWVRGTFDDEIKRAPGVRADGRPSEADISDKPAFFRKVPEMVGVERRGVREVERQRAEALYAWDVQFGRIMKTLKKTGQYDDTVVVFTSDNGYFLGEHRQRTGKIKPHEPSLRVPLVVAGPGIPHGVRQAPVTTIDLTATIIDLAGAAPLPAMDGRSAVPAFAKDRPWTVPVVTEGLQHLDHDVGGFPAGLTEMGLRTGRYAFFRYSTGEGELYDLFTDPLELRSRYDDPAYASVRHDLTRLWRRYRLCSADACRTPLPPEYVVSDRALARQVAKDERARARYYG